MESLRQCLEYRRGKVTLNLALPEKRPVCQYCVLGLQYAPNYDRYSCRFTGEPIYDPRHAIGDECPVEWEDENGKEIQPK